MKKELVIQIQHGGLGDHLFYSHLPRIAKQAGYERVLISNQSDFRNKNYKKLVWESNPHIDGTTDAPGIVVDNVRPTSSDMNLLDAIMLAHGLDDGIRGHEPELYYKPKSIEWLKGKTVYDPNYISNAGYVTAEKVIEYFKKNKIVIDYQMKVIGKHAIPILDFNSTISCASFFDFLDVVYSAEKLYCLVTGTATLAPALKKNAYVFFTKDQDPMFRHSKLNTYIQLS